MLKKLILFSIFALFSSCNFAYAQNSFEATVVSAADGDTVTIRHADGNLDRVRLLGLDAPEVAHNSKEISQPFGDFCKILLASKLASAKTVTVESARRDNYGRILGRILTDGDDVNLYVINNGCGWLYYPNGIPRDVRAGYEAAAATAMAGRIGLFSSGKAVTPKIWRKRRHLKRKRILL